MSIIVTQRRSMYNKRAGITRYGEKIWSEYRRRVKHILKTLKEVFQKKTDQGVLLDGLERLIT